MPISRNPTVLGALSSPASRYWYDAPPQIDVVRSQRSGFAMAHAGTKRKEEPRTSVRLILREPRQVRVAMMRARSLYTEALKGARARTCGTAN